MHAWVPNAIGQVGYYYETCVFPWIAVYRTPMIWNNYLIITSFPAYVYSMSMYVTYAMWGWLVTVTDYRLAPIDLVLGSNVIIVPRSSGAFVYNITSTI